MEPKPAIALGDNHRRGVLAALLLLDRNERRENALRPSPHLDYDRDALGRHLMSREAGRRERMRHNHARAKAP